MNGHAIIERIQAAVKCLPPNSKAKEIITLLSNDLKEHYTIQDNRIDALQRQEAEHHSMIKQYDRDLLAERREHHELRLKYQELKLKAEAALDSLVKINVWIAYDACKLIVNGRGISAIKTWRSYTGDGLAESKAAVEELCGFGIVQVHSAPQFEKIMKERKVAVRTIEVRKSALKDPAWNMYFSHSLV